MICVINPSRTPLQKDPPAILEEIPPLNPPEAIITAFIPEDLPNEFLNDQPPFVSCTLKSVPNASKPLLTIELIAPAAKSKIHRTPMKNKQLVR